MEQSSLLKRIVNKLEKAGIPYMLTGGIAVSFWGAPRTTFDIDMVLEIHKEDVEKIVGVFKKEFYISKEAVSGAIRHQTTFNIIHYKTGLKIDFLLRKNNPHRVLEFKRRLKKRIFGKDIFIVSPEDLILVKLQWFRDSQSTRHLEDIKSIFRISGDTLDFKYLKKWADRQSTLEILNEVINNK